LKVVRLNPMPQDLIISQHPLRERKEDQSILVDVREYILVR